MDNKQMTITVRGTEKFTRTIPRDSFLADLDRLGNRAPRLLAHEIGKRIANIHWSAQFSDAVLLHGVLGFDANAYPLIRGMALTRDWKRAPQVAVEAMAL